MRLLLAAATLAVIGHATADHVVSQKNKAFSTAALSVRVGEKVVFRNDDAVPHNVFSPTTGACVLRLNAAPGAESQTTFEKAGTVEVRCAFHPAMKLTVTVAP